MSKDEITRPDQKVAMIIADAVETRLNKMFQEPGLLDSLASRVADQVIRGLAAWRDEVDQDRSSTRIELARLRSDVDRLQEQVSNLRAVVYGPYFAAYLENARSPTDPAPPPGEEQ